MHRITRFRPAVLVATVFFWGPAAMRAQGPVVSYTDITTPELVKAGAPLGSYKAGDVDVVGMYNGGLSIRVPILQIGGRGTAGYSVTVPIYRRWRTQWYLDASYSAVNAVDESTTWLNPIPYYAPGTISARWSGSIPGATSCQVIVNGVTEWIDLFQKVLMRLTFQSADGTETEFYLQTNDGQPLTPTCANMYPSLPVDQVIGKPVFAASDASGARFILDGPMQIDGRAPDTGITSGLLSVPSGTLYLRDGTRIRFDTNGLTYIEDRNGNRTAFTYTAVSDLGQDAGHIRSHWGTSTITDSLGRQVSISYATSSTLCDVLSFAGYQNASRSVKVCYTNLQSRLATNISPASDYQPKTLSQLFPRLNIAFGNDPYDVLVVSSIVLPDSSSYQFFYNNHGEVARMVLPLGGKIEYAYGPGNTPNSTTNGANGEFGLSFNTYLGGQTAIYRRVTERRVYSDGATLDGTTVYTASSSTDLANCPGTYANGSLTVSADHRDANGQSLAKDIHYFCGNPGDINNLAALEVDPFAWPRWQEAQEFKSEQGDASDNVLRRTLSTIQQRNIDWWAGSQTAAPPRSPKPVQVDTALTDINPSVTSRTTFAYDQYSNVTDKTIYDFAQTAPGTVLRQEHTDYLTDSSYLTNDVYLPSLSSLQRIYLGGTDYARTVFEYDVYSGGTCVPASISCHAALVTRPGIVQFDSTYNSSTFTPRGNVTAVQQRQTSGTVDAYTYKQYDVAGNVVAAFDANGNKTTVAYDSTSNLYAFPQTITNPLNQQTSVTWDRYIGRPTQITDANNQSTTLDYTDLLDRLYQATDPLGTITFTYTPEAANYSVSIANTLDSSHSVQTTVYYDGLGREKQSTLNEGSTSISTYKKYDALGRVWNVSNPTRGTPTDWTQTAYDALGRPLLVTTPDSSPSYTSYSGNGTIAVDPASKWRSTITDALGRNSQVTEDPTASLTYGNVTLSNISTANPQLVTTYGYDPLGDLTSVSQGGRNRTFTYDSLKRLRTASNPEASMVTFGYDSAGNLRSRSDSRVSVSMTYDELNRVKTKTYTGGTSTPAVTYCYDGDTSTTSAVDCSSAPTANPPNSRNLIGRLTMVSNANSAASYSSYDALGRVLASSQTITGVANPYNFTYSYNHLDLASITYPSQRTVSYGFDSAGRVNQATNGSLTNGSNYVSSVAYAPHGAIASMTLGASIAESYTFNNRLQTTQIQAGPSGSLLKLGYGYGTAGANNGNVSSQSISYGAQGTETALTLNQAYVYDSLNRLSSWTEGAQGEIFGHDRWGNHWVSATSSGLTADPLTPSAPGWFSTADNHLNGVSYDTSGNQTQYNPFTTSYDAENRLQSITSTSNGSATYGYDGEGRRVWKTVSGATTRYVYNAMGELAAEYADAGTGAAGTQFLITDTLGSVRAIAAGNGDVQARYDYRPFGQEIPTGVNGRSTKYPTTTLASFPNVGDDATLKFTGKERDAETGLDFFGARYMSSAQGRFTSPDEPLEDQDPGDPQSWNLYSYVRNNPLKYIDPTGQDCVYTGDFSSSGTVRVETGSCTHKGGEYYEGTINQKSFRFNSTTGQLGFSYTKGDVIGAVIIRGLQAPPSDPLPPGVGTAFKQAGQNASTAVSTFAISAGVLATAYLSTYAVPAAIAGLAGETGAITLGKKALDGTKTVDSFLSGTLKKSQSYFSEYGSKTLNDVEKLAKEGDSKAAKMIKLVKQGARLQEKAGGKQ